MPPKLIFAHDKLCNINTQCPFSPTLSFWHSWIDAWLKCPWWDISAHCKWYGEAGRGGGGTPGLRKRMTLALMEAVTADTETQTHTFSHGLCWSSSSPISPYCCCSYLLKPPNINVAFQANVQHHMHLHGGLVNGQRMSELGLKSRWGQL